MDVAATAENHQAMTTRLATSVSMATVLGNSVWVATDSQSVLATKLATVCGNKHEFHENCHSITFHFIKKDSKRCYDTTMPESIHTKDESKRGSAFAFIFGVN